MMGKIRTVIAKNKKRAAEFSVGALLLAALQFYNNAHHDKQEEHQRQFEVFFSNYQDSIDCKLSQLRANCNH